MKYLVTLLMALSLSFGAVAQDTPPDTCFTQEQIINITNNIKDLQDSIAVMSDIIAKQDEQIANYERLAYQDSILLALHSTEIDLYKHEVNLYLDLYKTTKPKWYDSKILWFGVGVGTVTLSSWILSNIK